MLKLNTITMAIVMAFSLPLGAQDNERESDDATKQASAKNDTAIEVISVTATKRKTKLMETPVAISALS